MSFLYFIIISLNLIILGLFGLLFYLVGWLVGFNNCSKTEEDLINDIIGVAFKNSKDDTSGGNSDV